MAGLFSTTSSSSTQSNTLGDLKSDVALDNPPEDSISGLAFNPNPADQKDFLAVASWDKKVRIYEILPNGQGQPKAQIEHEGPVLSVDFFKVCFPFCVMLPFRRYHAIRKLTLWQDGTKVISAGADKQAKVLDLASGQTVQVAAHDSPIKSVRYCEINGAQMAVTGSWDKTIKYWDFRQQTPVGTLACQERVYTMDVRENLLVVGTADRYINVINLADPTKFYKTIQSPLKWQTRVVSCFIDSAGFAIGSIEGRCAIQYVDDKDNAYVHEIHKSKEFLVYANSL